MNGRNKSAVRILIVAAIVVGVGNNIRLLLISDATRRTNNKEISVLSGALLAFSKGATRNNVTTTSLMPPCEEVGGMPFKGIFVRINGTKFHKYHTYQNGNLGNVLSPYWAARAIAELGGYEFQGTPFHRGTWTKYLPQGNVTAVLPNLDWYTRTCKCREWWFFHKCIGWGYIQKTIFKDTRAALQAYAQTRPENETTQAFQINNSKDWLIYDRCCIFCHYLFGISNIHAYDIIPTNGSFTVYSLSPPNIDSHEGNGMCEPLHRLRDVYLKWRNPNITIISLPPHRELWVDFARIVYAPNLLIPTVGSSFALWSSLANDKVHIAQPMPNIPMDALPDTYHILPSPVLFGMEAKNYFQMSQDPNAEMKKAEIRSRVIQWWMNDVSFEAMEATLDEVLMYLNISRAVFDTQKSYKSKESTR